MTLRPQLKFSGSYPLPYWGLGVSATFQSLPGIPIGFTTGGLAANSGQYSATNAEVRPSLGRDLARGATGVTTVFLVEPNQYFEDRLNQLDIRFSKRVRVGRASVRANFDVYNLFNSATVLAVNGTYPRDFLKPTQVLGARVFKFGAVLDF